VSGLHFGGFRVWKLECFGGGFGQIWDKVRVRILGQNEGQILGQK